ncbi:Bug family tripartite tricarboxylate transporter substrate binding protein [Roseococcus thiosulfatophilus]|uniref:Bug family tripartite tricarboxylate transporter substrate binding protein n=1 Tax=Roseococcus thiosulfatophilus TaxID=35813 RepID=UPI001A8D0018|nr:tripartite tricarboxylate transporter substrate-binding protein [Roseococcus thiosulfatophilus]
MSPLARRSLLGLVLAPLAGPASAQAWPSRPLRFIVPFAPGGTTDILARLLAPRLSETFGQPVTVENRGGAGGVPGTEAIARAAPDGHAFGLVISGHVATPFLVPTLPYDPIADFAPVMLAARTPMVLVVPARLPAADAAAFAALLGTRGTPLSYASSGLGSVQHLAMERLSAQLGVEMLHIPYRGSGPALADLASGTVDAMFMPTSTWRPHAANPMLRALAISSPEQSPAFRDLPTLSATIAPGFAAAEWWAVLAPRSTPAPLVEQLRHALAQALAHPETARRLRETDVDVLASGPDALMTALRAELAANRDLAARGVFRPG